MSHYEAETRGVRVRVSPQYIPERSDPDEQTWAFAYTVEIANLGVEAVRLLRRHWFITDARGHVEEVEGPGVVGETPVLEPGEAFRYTSWCPLKTPTGSMHGTYRMITGAGEPFDAEIPAFSLDAPGAAGRLN